MTTKLSISYTWSDAWLLYAVIMETSAVHGADLVSIVSHGDCIQHAIFTYEEISNGLMKLLHGGLIKQDKRLFLPTHKTIIAYKKLKSKSIGLLKTQDAIEKLINKDFSLPMNMTVKPIITKREYQNSVEKYIKIMQKKVKALPR